MFANQLNQIIAKTYVTAYDLQHNQAELAARIVKRIERGDADSSGSTMRTAGIVALVLAVVGLIATAVNSLGTTTAGQIRSPF